MVSFTEFPIKRFSNICDGPPLCLHSQRPEVVASEALRVLRPGGSLMVSFSDACWPEKAVAGWLDRGGGERQLLISK